MEQGFNTDIICNVLANGCSIEIIKAVLDEFLPAYEKLNLDYTSPPNDENYQFQSEDEMLRFFIENKALAQSFYWNKRENNPDKIMIGAKLTKDNKLIISLSFNGTPEKERYYFLKLKSFLKTTIGVVSYINPPEYEDGEDFKNRYQNTR